MNTHELLELCEFALVRADTELWAVDCLPGQLKRRKAFRASSLNTIRAALAALAVAASIGSAQAADVSSHAKAVAKAEQSVRLAQCKLDNLQGPGFKTNTTEYFGHMFHCMSR